MLDTHTDTDFLSFDFAVAMNLEYSLLGATSLFFARP